MRIAFLCSFLALLTSPSVVAAAVLPEVAEAGKRSTDNAVKSTTYNGREVPPLVELSGKTFQDDITSGYWLVKAFSPYCGHCMSLEPKWQTLYEYYYTSIPTSPASDSTPSTETFSHFYDDLTFATLDCVAFGNACNDIKVESFPTMILLKDGKELNKIVGNRSMKTLAKFMEENLELIKPGSRPETPPTMPKAGTHGDPSLASKAPAAIVHKDPLGSSSDAQRAANRPTKNSGHPDGKYKVAPAVFVPSNSNANPDGKSVQFTAESFDKQVAKTLNAWLVKFYAPWCPHCIAMGPSWDAMAREMKGKLDIGEVNCEAEKGLCRSMGVEAYPQIKLMRGPETIEYEGLRGLGDLVSYANHAVEALAGVEDVSAVEFEALEKKHDVLFVYFYDVATTTEDFQALERLPMHLVGQSKLVKSKDADLVKRFKIHTWPQLIVVRESQVDTYPGLSPAQMRNVTSLVKWTHTVWLPLVPEVTASNARDIMDRKFVVLAILSRDRADEFTAARREIKSAAIEWMEKERHALDTERQELRDAKQLRIEEAEDRRDEQGLIDAKSIHIDMEKLRPKGVRFAWVDGVFWERWVRTTYGVNVREGEQVIINDEENHLYWDKTVTGNAIVPSRTSILETLPKVVASPPKLSPRVAGSSLSYVYWTARHMLRHHSTPALFGTAMLVLVVFVLRRPLRRLIVAATMAAGGNGGGGGDSRGRNVSYGTARFLSLGEKGERGEGFGVSNGPAAKAD